MLLKTKIKKVVATLLWVPFGTIGWLLGCGKEISISEYQDVERWVRGCPQLKEVVKKETKNNIINWWGFTGIQIAYFDILKKNNKISDLKQKENAKTFLKNL